MFILELQTSFKVVASILNSRPIYARWGNRGEDDPDFLSPLTPNMLLTGRANVEIPVRNYLASDKPLLRLQYVEETVSQWWHQFATQNFSSLVPRQKWYFERRNIACGDVVLVQYEGKYKPATYRLGVVTEVQTDSDGMVRTVWVEYSLLAELPYSVRLAYKGITKKKIKVSVQRLVLILPVEERDTDGGRVEGHAGAALPNEGVLGGQQVGAVGARDPYAVVWNGVEGKHVHQAGDRGEATVASVGCGGVVPAGDLGDVAPASVGHGGVFPAGELGDLTPAGVGHVVADQEEGVGCQSVAVSHGNSLKESRLGFSRKIQSRVMSCKVLQCSSKVHDYEKVVYSALAENFDWKEIDDSLEVL
jgi:hypothetical protein